MLIFIKSLHQFLFFIFTFHFFLQFQSASDMVLADDNFASIVAVCYFFSIKLFCTSSIFRSLWIKSCEEVSICHQLSSLSFVHILYKENRFSLYIICICMYTSIEFLSKLCAIPHVEQL